MTVGFFSGLTGLDRIGLGRYLRQANAEVRLVETVDALEAGIESGEFQAGVTEALGARQLAGKHDWTAQWMPAPIERHQLGLGIWRGDLTLLQAIEGVMGQLTSEGFLDELLEKYQIAPMAGTLGEGQPAP